MPGFPDKYMPFMDRDPWGNAGATFQKFTYGPVFRYFRKRNIDKKFDKEPEWRTRGPALTSGYSKRW
jgi:hydrogenase small subunit